MQGSRDRRDIISSTEELDSSAFTLLNGFVTGTAESSSQSRDFLPEIDTSSNFSLSLDEHDSTEVPPAPMSVSFSDICSYLEIYQCKMYPVWPVVERTKLLAKLADNREDHETCALATAVCAATGAQLKLDKDMAMSDRFAAEAEKHRAMYLYRDYPTVAGILVPFFLHTYYLMKERRNTATILLRESITFAQLLKLDREESYAQLEPAEQLHRRKIFWLLFVTERGHALQHDVPVSLHNSIEMPKAEDDGFFKLAHLFLDVDEILIGAHDRRGAASRAYTKELLANLQQQLSRIEEDPPYSNEVQKADICVTRQWLRVLVWQISMKHIIFSRRSGDGAMSLTYPTQVARDSLSFLAQTSLDSLAVHGPGMELKLFEIANTLLDVITCVPLSEDLASRITNGPWEMLRSLTTLMWSLSNGHRSSALSLLLDKVAKFAVPHTPAPRMIEPNHGDTQVPNDQTSTNSTADGWSEFH
ncbi:hypothetical protein V501_01119 [Pseudogymnoascus sp. VKM F-4519 (FW-2642)]|nr:hypothetical protein V500_00838 [Pseudogymnoascus sp. VKM F-4518 (FW-2643)]KFZ18613.1 hypothetical protein V501_01119 [Pseudogymnoascus sp. VKM F-4519 (FW-2642)]